MKTYLAVLILMTMIGMVSLAIGLIWIVVGPWRMIGRIGRHTRVKRGVIQS